jgi:hypothetical protein
MLLATGVVGACSGKAPEARDQAGAATVAAAPDSLVLKLADSAEVWFTTSLLDSTAAGDVCVARGMEIRKRDASIPVPLLYTTEGPTVVNDTTLRAALFRDCVAVDTYLVNTRTGQPRRVVP